MVRLLARLFLPPLYGYARQSQLISRPWYLYRYMKDAQIKKLIAAEKARQDKVINLIASENYVSKDVLEALGSELTNKYSEGYAGRRYYGGNEVIDKIERLCVERALK